MVGESSKVVIVTGGSSGIGRCTASALKENSCIVYEFSRRNIPMEGVTHLSVDVTDCASSCPPQHAERSWGKYTGNRRIAPQSCYIN